MNHTQFKKEMNNIDIGHILLLVGEIVMACKMEAKNIKLKEDEQLKLREQLEGYLYDILYKRPRGHEGKLLLKKIYFNEESR